MAAKSPGRFLADAPFGTTTALACLAYARHCIHTTIWSIETFGYDHDEWLRFRGRTRSDVLARLRGDLYRIEQRIARYLDNGIDKNVPVVPWNNC